MRIVLAYEPCSRTASSYSAPIPSPESWPGVSRYRCAGLRRNARVDQAGQGQVAPAARHGPGKSTEGGRSPQLSEREQRLQLWIKR